MLIAQNIILLPGLHGTGDLFGPLIAELPDSCKPIVISYPNDKLLDYNQLADHAQQQLPDQTFVIVAESFSGHVAHILAERNPADLKSVHFFASFLSNPNPLLLNWLTLPFAGLPRMLLPSSMLRNRMIGDCADDELWALIESTIEGVPKATIKHRLELIAKTKPAPKTTEIPYHSVVAAADSLVNPKYTIGPPWTNEGSQQSIPGPHLLLQTRPKHCVELILGVAL